MTVPTDRTPRAGEVYRHYKGGIYAVICVVPHTETEETIVVYQSLAGGDRWARPLAMWSDMVEVPGGLVNRFTLQQEDPNQPLPMICKVARSGGYGVVLDNMPDPCPCCEKPVQREQDLVCFHRTCWRCRDRRD